MDTLIYSNNHEIELKAVEGTTFYNIKFPLVLFTDESQAALQKDFDGDFFTPDADYDLDENGQGKSYLYFNHGLDSTIKKVKLGKGRAGLTQDEKAVWLEHQLDMANDYDEMVITLIKERQKRHKKSFGGSSGVAAHLVEREIVGNARKVTKWPLGSDASITLIPNDWRQTIMDLSSLEPSNIKALLDTDYKTSSTGYVNIDATGANINITYPGADPYQPEAQPEAKAGSAANGKDTDKKTNKQTNVEVTDMSDENNDKAPPEDEKKAVDLEAMVDAKLAPVLESTKKINEFLEAIQNDKPLSRSGYYTMDGGRADPSIKSIGDMMIAVARQDVERLRSVYDCKTAEEVLTGMKVDQNTLQGTEGGWFVRPQVLTDIGLDISLVGPIANLVHTIPVTSPSGTAPIPYVRGTPAGSGETATASGINSQARKEGSAYTQETVLIDELSFDVSDFATGYLRATNMQMRAGPMIESLLNAKVREDIGNKKEYGILRGSGQNGQPLGVLNSGLVIGVAEDTANTFVAADLDEMQSHLLESSANIAWVYHNSIYTSVAPLVQPGYYAGTRNAGPGTMLGGYPHFKSQHLPVVDNDGYIILGDWYQYKLFVYGGLYINFSDQRYIDEGKVAWFFGQWLDGKPVLPASVILADGTFTVGPFVAINDTA